MRRVHDCLVGGFIGTETIGFEAANGTPMLAEMSHHADGDPALLTDFSLGLFPVMIFSPANFHPLNGQLVIEHFITSSSMRAYADSVLILETPVMARNEDSRMVNFSGGVALIRRLRTQLERAAAITGGEACRLDTWYTGINPFIFFDGDPYTDLERWGTARLRFTALHPHPRRRQRPWRDLDPAVRHQHPFRRPPNLGPRSLRLLRQR